VDTRSWNALLKKTLANAEIIFIVIYLFFAESTTIPAQLSTVINVLNYLFVGVMLWRLWQRMVYVLLLDLALVILMAFTVCSIFWSVDVDYSIRMLLGMLRTTVFGLYLATSFSFPAQLKLFTWVSGWIVAVNLLIYVVVPAWGTVPDPNEVGKFVFVGIYSFKQQTGRIMALALVTLLLNFRANPRQRWLTVVGILGAALLLVRAQSATYIIAVAVAMLVSPLRSLMRQRFQVRGLFLVLTLLIVAGLGGFLLFNWESLVVSLGKGITFNGRTPVWTLTIDELVKRPYFGYGYAAFWGSDEGWRAFRGVPWAWAQYKTGFDVRSNWTAHNGFLDLAMQIGLVGLALLLLHILLVIGRSLRLMAQSNGWESLWMLQVLVIQLVGSGFEPPVHLASNSIHWILYVSMAGTSALMLRRMPQHQVRSRLWPSSG
jgi:exopolysaccharide production protein ExoQ